MAIWHLGPAQDSHNQKKVSLPYAVLGHVLHSSLILGLHCAAMSVEPHHTDSVAEEAALRPGKHK